MKGKNLTVIAKDVTKVGAYGSATCPLLSTGVSAGCANIQQVGYGNSAPQLQSMKAGEVVTLTPTSGFIGGNFLLRVQGLIVGGLVFYPNSASYVIPTDGIYSFSLSQGGIESWSWSCSAGS